ncbi:MAG: hypothetical protein ACREU7_05245, partial [Burkholderiales bacterium]
MNRATSLRRSFVLAGVCAAALISTAASARTLAEVQSLGTISMCAHPDALPYASKNPDAPGI